MMTRAILAACEPYWRPVHDCVLTSGTVLYVYDDRELRVKYRARWHRRWSGCISALYWAIMLTSCPEPLRVEPCAAAPEARRPSGAQPLPP
jgi:hypothetical protein